ncbi:MAG: periplasmic heavy metal sensor [Dongiaceae bacterium]
MTVTGRTGTALVIGAIVSVCLNLLLAGVMIGGHWHGGPGRHGPFGEGPFWTRLPDEARPIVKGVFESHKAEFDAHRKQVQDAKQKVAEALKADPIDQAQLDQALSELMQQSQAMQEFGHQVMVDIARKLPPDLRREMADRWARDRFRRKPDEPEE